MPFPIVALHRPDAARPPVSSPFHSVPLPGPFGAEIHGLDLAAALPEATLDAIHAAIARDHLLVFPNQALSPAHQLAFTRRLGRVQTHPLAPASTSDVVIESERSRGDAWHHDLAYTPTPNRLSIVQVAETSGNSPSGTIVFADQCAAYEQLDPWLAHSIEFLEIEHDASVLEPPNPLPMVSHPLVRVDPETRRRSLFVDSRTGSRIPGVSPAESARLLARLHAAATKPDVTWHHVLRPGELLVWDSLALLHRLDRATNGRGARILRTMVAGERPVGPAATTLPWVSAG